MLAAQQNREMEARIDPTWYNHSLTPTMVAQQAVPQFFLEPRPDDSETAQMKEPNVWQTDS